MRARIKATGELVQLAPYTRVCEDYTKGRSWLIQELEDAEEIDYWTRLEHQYAGMAMQGMIKTYEQMMRDDIECKMDCCEHVDAYVANGVLRSHADACAEFCVEFAHVLIQKLKEKEERK